MMREILIRALVATLLAPASAVMVARAPAALATNALVVAPATAGGSPALVAPALTVAASGLALPSPALATAAGAAATSVSAKPTAAAEAVPTAAPSVEAAPAADSSAPSAPAEVNAAAPAAAPDAAPVPTASAASSLKDLGRTLARAIGGSKTAAALEQSFSGSRDNKTDESETTESEAYFVDDNPRVLDWRYARAVHRLAGVPAREEGHDLAVRKAGGELRARQELIERNLRLVIKTAYEYKKYGYPIDELVQEGNIGLIRAVVKLDPAKGNTFATYAGPWIRSVIMYYIQQNWNHGNSATTQGERKLFWGLRKVQKAVAREHGAGAADDPERIAAFINAQTAQKRLALGKDETGGLRVNPEEVRKMADVFSRPIISLDVPVDNDGDSSASHLDLTPASDAPPDELIDTARKLTLLKSGRRRR